MTVEFNNAGNLCQKHWFPEWRITGTEECLQFLRDGSQEVLFGFDPFLAEFAFSTNARDSRALGLLVNHVP